MTARISDAEQPVHEYRELHDTVYPRLVNAQCTCGWRMAGYAAGWIAVSFFERHRDEVSGSRSQEDK
jgi:hypothetical protein